MCDFGLAPMPGKGGPREPCFRAKALRMHDCKVTKGGRCLEENGKMDEHVINDDLHKTTRFTVSCLFYQTEQSFHPGKDGIKERGRNL